MTYIYVTVCRLYKVAFCIVGRKNSPRSWRRRRGVHNHGRFIRVPADIKHDFHYVGHESRLKKSSSASSAMFSTVGQPVRYTLLFNSVSHISSSQ